MFCLLACLHFRLDLGQLGDFAHFEDKLVQNWGGPLDHFLIGSESYNCGFGSRANLDQHPLGGHSRCVFRIVGIGCESDR